MLTVNLRIFYIERHWWNDLLENCSIRDFSRNTGRCEIWTYRLMLFALLERFYTNFSHSLKDLTECIVVCADELNTSIGLIDWSFDSPQTVNSYLFKSDKLWRSDYKSHHCSFQKYYVHWLFSVFFKALFTGTRLTLWMPRSAYEVVCSTVFISFFLKNRRVPYSLAAGHLNCLDIQLVIVSEENTVNSREWYLPDQALILFVNLEY